MKKSFSYIRRVSGIVSLICFVYFVAEPVLFNFSASFYNIWPQTFCLLVIQPLFFYSIAVCFTTLRPFKTTSSTSKPMIGFGLALSVVYPVLMLLSLFVPAIWVVVQMLTKSPYLFLIPGFLLGFGVCSSLFQED